ncbi:MAG: glycosyltransferase family 2 protein, partial [Planctomycetota bacterium]
EALRCVRGVDAADLVVVDDGSVDSTASMLARVLPTLSFPARVLGAAPAGPAVARNRGIEATDGDLLAFLGDDTLPAEGWLEAHRNAHERHDGGAVVGDIRWHPDCGRDAFLDYLAPRGLQFDLGDGVEPGFARFFTANLSLRRDVLGDERFDEGFAEAAWEDIELGWRLERKGVRLAFERDAVVEHLHPTDLRRFTERMERCGRGARRALALHAELEPVTRPRRPRLQRLAGRVVSVIPDAVLPSAARTRRWDLVLGAAYCRGFEAADRDRSVGVPS